MRQRLLLAIFLLLFVLFIAWILQRLNDSFGLSKLESVEEMNTQLNP